jgi:hypothetical protein
MTGYLSGQIEEITMSFNKISKNVFLKLLPVLLWCEKMLWLKYGKRKSSIHLIQKGGNQPRKRRKIKSEDQKKMFKLVFSMQS